MMHHIFTKILPVLFLLQLASSELNEFEDSRQTSRHVDPLTHIPQLYQTQIPQDHARGLLEHESDHDLPDDTQEWQNYYRNRNRYVLSNLVSPSTYDDGSGWPINYYLTPPRRSKQRQTNNIPEKIYDYRYYDQTTYLYGDQRPIRVNNKIRNYNDDLDFDPNRQRAQLIRERPTRPIHDDRPSSQAILTNGETYKKAKDHLLRSSPTELDHDHLRDQENGFRQTKQIPTEEIHRVNGKSKSRDRSKSLSHSRDSRDRGHQSHFVDSKEALKHHVIDVDSNVKLTMDDYRTLCFYTLYYFRNKDFGFFCARSLEQNLPPLTFG